MAHDLVFRFPVGRRRRPRVAAHLRSCGAGAFPENSASRAGETRTAQAQLDIMAHWHD